MTERESPAEHVRNALALLVALRADLDAIERRLRAALAQLNPKP